jgi:acetylornithine deacetylase
VEQKSPDNFLELHDQALEVLQKLISIPSLSKEEDKTANFIEQFLQGKGVKIHRQKNNIWAFNQHYSPLKPTILLNSHHDTVKPNSGYSLDPFTPIIKDGKLFGLGSNDAGGALVSLMAAFLYFYDKENLKYNFIYAATAEEENSGLDGVESVLKHFGEIEFAIVGEPTEMHMAIAEKGLMVVDCEAPGTSSHAAHPNEDNAIYNAIRDIEWIKNYRFPKVSEALGEVKMTVSVINAGKLHNMVPNTCTFTIDVRTTDQYSNREVLEIIRENIKSKAEARGFRLNSSSISIEHPVVKAGIEMGRNTYGSPTTSDQAVIPYPSLKMGPGLSARSHSSDEYIFVDEIHEGIKIYIELLSKIVF